MAALSTVSRALAEAGLDQPRISAVLSGRITDLLGDACGVHLLTDDEAWLRATSVDHRDARAREVLRAQLAKDIPADAGPSREVLRGGATLFVPVAAPDDFTARVPTTIHAYARQFPIHSLVMVPIRAGDTVMGTIFLSRHTADCPYTEDDKGWLQEVGDRAGWAFAAAAQHERLNKERDRLRARAQEMEAVLAAAPVAIWIAQDPECRTVTGNAESNRICRSNGDVPPLKIVRKGYEIPPSELPLQLSAATGLPQRHVEFELVFGDGPSCTMFGSASPLFDEEGRPRGSVGAFVDVTPLHNAIRLRDDFLSVVSHELKTPLTSIELNITSLLRAFKTGRISRMTPEEIEQRLQGTWRETTRLGTLVNDLLDVSRLSAGRLVLQRTSVDLRELLDDIVGRFRDQAARDRSQLSVIPGSLVVGYWDRNRLDQIVTNLVSNALKYGRGKPVTIAIESSAVGARVSVKDEGIGIAPADQARVFRRFERAVADGRLEGVGLGLWIVRQLVEAHGGTISVTSALGRGATFVVQLPVGADPDDPRDHRPTEHGAR